MFKRALVNLRNAAPKTQFSGFRAFSTRAANAKKLFNTKTLLVSTGLLSASLFYSSKKFQSTEQPANEYHDVEAGPADALFEGQMKDVQVGPNKEDTVLIARYNGKLFCVSSFCTHFGAPLSTGVLFDDRIMCPWHCASFSLVNGLAEEGPVWDNLFVHKIREEDGKIIVTVPKVLPKGKVPQLATRNPKDDRRFVIVGAGPAALSAAQTLRQSKYEGEIVLLTAESELPYDRTIITKNLLGVQPGQITIRSKDFLDTYGINVRTNTRVQQVDVANNVVKTQGGEEIRYDKLLVATGGTPRVPNLPGVNLQNVYTVRTIEDAQRLRDSVKNAKNVVIIGASFIGLESASSIKKELKDNANVIVADMAQVPAERVFGKEVGSAIQTLHEQNGVQFALGKGLKSIEGSNGKVQEVVFSDGSRIQADVVLLGTGVSPATDIIKNQLQTTKDGGIITDPYLRSSDHNVFAAGDVACYPYWYTCLLYTSPSPRDQA
eukprot:TRINITY_DN7465_c0_g2_i3.p1 TRINITY_DN7465_c0_g2~~TRINITY_DN7465_c0_g2_i3.p1  ORF type:complete len:491 (+),score=141.74 TRINITY_DN7465_c0_g2_i3:1-1473(+)